MPQREDKFLDALRAALPRLTIEPRASGATIVLPDGSPLNIRVVWAGHGFPRDVERALREIDEAEPTVVTAESFSEGALRLIEERGLNWASRDGGARISIGGLFVDREPKPRPIAATALDRNDAPRWTEAVSTVAETVLAAYAAHRNDLIPPVADLAAGTHRSTGTVSAALREFDRHGWSEPSKAQRGRSAKRVLRNPGPMLTSWSAYVSTHTSTTSYYSLHKEPARVASALEEAFGTRVAFGGRFAAHHLAPFSTTVAGLMVYASTELDDMTLREGLADAGLSAGGDSRRFQVAQVPEVVLDHARDVRGHMLVSPIRIYADLLGDGVRGPESAEHLRASALGF